LANARIAVLTQNVLDQGREFPAKNFKGSRLGDERDFIALGYPHMSVFIVVGPDHDSSHFSPFRNIDDTTTSYAALLKKSIMTTS
jgi:hypothetical protein